MLEKLVLIIDKRKELPAKYKKIIENNGANVISTTTFEQALEILSSYEPDLILVSDSIDKETADVVKKLRIMSYPSRPCIITLSKSAELQDKLKALDAGADDFLSEPIDSDEFNARINAHLRRHFESFVDEITQLPNLKTSLRVLKRTISENKKWSAMLIRINNFEAYRQIYGELAADKMLQTSIAIINSALDKSDYLGELANNEFIILTTPLKSEHIASYLVYAFNTIVEKFYSEEDAKQGYIILNGDDNIGKRIDLVSISIGVISSELQNYTNVNNAINGLLATCKLAKTSIGSSFVIERAKISAQNSVIQKEFNNKILIIEPDEALNFLLKTTGEMQGYEVKTLSNYNDTFSTIQTFNPALIILDAGKSETMEGLDYCKKIKKDTNHKNTKIIVSTVVHDKKLVLNTGADLYLPKPYELLGLFNRIEHLIKEFNDE